MFSKLNWLSEELWIVLPLACSYKLSAVGERVGKLSRLCPFLQSYVLCLSLAHFYWSFKCLLQASSAVWLSLFYLIVLLLSPKLWSTLTHISLYSSPWLETVRLHISHILDPWLFKGKGYDLFIFVAQCLVRQAFHKCLNLKSYIDSNGHNQIYFFLE